MIACGENPICAWISVTDSGEGLTPAQTARLFRRFQGSGASPGYGIGLPLAQTILRGQNGDLDVDADGLPPHVAALTGDAYSGATFTLKVYR